MALKRFELKLTEKIKQDIKTQLNYHESTQNRLHYLGNQLQNLDDILQNLQKNIPSEVITENEINSFLNLHQAEFEQKLLKINGQLKASIETLNRQNQSAQDQIKNIKQKLNTVEQSNKPQPATQECLPTNINQEEIEISKGDAVIKWLNERDIKVEKHFLTKGSAYDQAFKKLAIYLGKNYASLAQFHEKLINSINQHGNKFQLPLRNQTQNDLQIHTQFGSYLKNAGCFSTYYYDQKTKIINFAVHAREDLKRFLCGDWFELFIFDKISKFFRSRELSYESLVNAKVIFPNNDICELDLIFLVQEHLFWIECKAGKNLDNIERYLPKYSNNHQNFLQIPKPNALIVCLHLNNEKANIRTAGWKNVTVTNPELLLTSIQSVLEGTVNYEIADENNKQPITPNSEKNGDLVYLYPSTISEDKSSVQALVL
ncbi:hypothetical protein Sta7437_0531 [Stanieria cyanosphaera PCC 7437]|uniref:Uncharacterized protein n=1 Tax=Stanieria cyanosphaera (strain ATCC 29371 / PCC 7437) TaxID=111780 RepID=K9XNE9_STAC7|nr:DUF1887 family CARF protein [Stanieria cyanosphaera]AFZ34135.1 hypothetical protein Sta7437_0531 [Stanieria cyanosphaera PCC 7437]